LQKSRTHFNHKEEKWCIIQNRKSGWITVIQCWCLSVMGDYGVLPITDSFSIQRCLTWAEPSRQVQLPRERPQCYVRARPFSGMLATSVLRNFI